MPTFDYMAANNLFLLGSVFLIVLVSFLWFLRKPQNRHPMDGPKGRMLDEKRAKENAQGVTEVPPSRR